MNFHFFHFLVVVVLALLVHADTTPGIRAKDEERSNALFGILDNSINFSAIVEAVMPRIKEWFVQKPFQSTFSAIVNASSVFEKLAEYVVESKKGFRPEARSVYSSNENETTFQFEPRLRYRGIKVKRYVGIEVKLTLLFRASEHEFLASEFHRLCDRKGPTITLVRADNGRMAAAYNGVDWGRPWGRASNPQGFLASIVNDPGAIRGYSLQKYAATDGASVYSHPHWGPDFGGSLFISNRCNENENSYSFRVNPKSLFGVRDFRVLEYEVFHVEIQTIV
jgi:hypothetical protein